MLGVYERRPDDRRDTAVFIAAFLGGVAAIIAVRLLKDGGLSGGDPDPRIGTFDFLAIFVAVGVIAVYTAYIALTTSRSGISIDRASDNVYYLGLLFTLTSLAYSLVKISLFIGDPEADQVSQIQSLLPDFGLALFSTVVGIFGRILLQQMRSDSIESKADAREEINRERRRIKKELDLGSRELKETIHQTILGLNALSAQTSLGLSELRQNISKNLEEAAGAQAKALGEAASKQIGTLEEATNRQVGALETATNAQVEALGKATSAQIGTLEGATNAQVEALREATESINTLSSTLQQQKDAIAGFVSRSIGQLTSLLDDLKSQFDSLQGAPKQLTDSFAELSAATRTASDLIQTAAQSQETLATQMLRSANALQQIDGAARETVDSTGQFARALGQVRERLQEFEGAPEELRSRFADLSAEVFKAVELTKTAADNQRRLANDLLEAIRSLQGAFSEEQVMRISDAVSAAVQKSEELNQKMADSEPKVATALDGINTLVSGLRDAARSMTEHSDRIKASAQSANEASEEYVDALGEAADTLRGRTDDTQ